MTTALIYLVVMVLVAAVVFLLSALVFGRGEELAPLPPGASPTRLPPEDVTSNDVRSLRFQQVVRGYKMAEVDWVLERLATEVDELRDRIAELEGVSPEPESEPEPEPVPEPVPEPEPVPQHAADNGSPS